MQSLFLVLILSRHNFPAVRSIPSSILRFCLFLRSCRSHLGHGSISIVSLRDRMSSGTWPGWAALASTTAEDNWKETEAAAMVSVGIRTIATAQLA